MVVHPEEGVNGEQLLNGEGEVDRSGIEEAVSGPAIARIPSSYVSRPLCTLVAAQDGPLDRPLSTCDQNDKHELELELESDRRFRGYLSSFEISLCAAESRRMVLSVGC
jgi:hypothetical protein